MLGLVFGYFSFSVLLKVIFLTFFIMCAIDLSIKIREMRHCVLLIFTIR